MYPTISQVWPIIIELLHKNWCCHYLISSTSDSSFYVDLESTEKGPPEHIRPPSGLLMFKFPSYIFTFVPPMQTHSPLIEPPSWQSISTMKKFCPQIFNLARNIRLLPCICSAMRPLLGPLPPLPWGASQYDPMFLQNRFPLEKRLQIPA